jgi:hypothetical protein
MVYSGQRIESELGCRQDARGEATQVQGQYSVPGPGSKALLRLIPTRPSASSRCCGGVLAHKMAKRAPAERQAVREQPGAAPPIPWPAAEQPVTQHHSMDLPVPT